MRVFLTGHEGYIGTVLAPMLIAKGHDVVGCDSGLFERCTFGTPPPEIPNLRKDIRDLEAHDLDGFDAVVHLAGLSNDPLGDLDPALTDEINHLASVRLARQAKAARVERFVFSSSCSNYGAAGDDFLTETSAFNPVTPYGRSKVAVERAVARLADAHFVPTFMRNATAFGVSPRLRFDLVLNNLTAWAVTTGDVYLKSDGTAWRPIVHIEDIGRAVAAVLDAPAELVRNEAFNVGVTGENYRIRELAEIVAETVPNTRLRISERASADTRNYRVDCDKYARAFPSAPLLWTARRGAQELLAAYRDVGIRLEDFEGDRFQRIAHLRRLRADGLVDGSLRPIALARPVEAVG